MNSNDTHTYTHTYMQPVPPTLPSVVRSADLS